MARARFAGKSVVVTGASAGVGRAVARAFGEAGARVALLAPGDEGAHGELDAGSRERSLSVWLGLRRRPIAAGPAAAAPGAPGWRALRRA